MSPSKGGQFRPPLTGISRGGGFLFSPSRLNVAIRRARRLWLPGVHRGTTQHPRPHDRGDGLIATLNAFVESVVQPM